ncbi:hypothetical protein ACTXT7_010773 [Hymenolepis weldensis]
MSRCRRDDRHPFRYLCAHRQTHSGTTCGHRSGDLIATNGLQPLNAVEWLSLSGAFTMATWLTGPSAYISNAPDFSHWLTRTLYDSIAIKGH